MRFHSIGGWGAITTGKNLGAILGDLNDLIFERDGERDDLGNPKEVIHVSANPKYGSEKKGAPTSYFMVAAKDRIRVNCDLRHVTVVLCCDPKAFTHYQPARRHGRGRLRWSGSRIEEGEQAWERLPLWARKQIIDKNIRVFTLPGFDIAKKATDRGDLQLRMQGNAFLGAFFAVSSLLNEFGITQEQYRDVVHKQYVKKFGKLGDAVVAVQHGSHDAGLRPGEGDQDRRARRGRPLQPARPGAAAHSRTRHRRRFLRHRLPFHTRCPPARPRARRWPASPTSTPSSAPPSATTSPPRRSSAMGMIAAATGDTASKYVARRETPLYIPENCTQCMECISVCPDTALPNTSQDLSTLLTTAVSYYVADAEDRAKLLAALPEIEKQARQRMLAEIKTGTPLPTILREVTESVDGFSAAIQAAVLRHHRQSSDGLPEGERHLLARPSAKRPAPAASSPSLSPICARAAPPASPPAATTTRSAWSPRPRRSTPSTRPAPASSTCCPTPRRSTSASSTPPTRPTPRPRRCATCSWSAPTTTRWCPATAPAPAAAKRASCAPSPPSPRPTCAPSSTPRATALWPRPASWKRKAPTKLAALKQANPAEYALLRQAIAHLVLGLGGEDEADTRARIAAYEAEHGPITDAELVEAIAAVLLTEAFNHKNLQAVDGRLANGMSVMAMAAHTGCNTVYGSTAPNNPHPYPWMNSLFQDGVTVGWLMGESFIVDHARRSVIPERLADILLTRDGGLTDEEYYHFTHFTDALMTDQEIVELPKVWVVGGDGGMGDIGYQNMSKVVLQNRPNVKVLMLDTQVYSNTGGQNSDSTPMLGGNDMNAFGAATQGKNTEKKTVAETFLAGHGSPFVAQVSMANAPKLYRAILDGLEYRGTMFLQAFTTCQPEHGVADDMALHQAQRVRDSRGVPEFVFNPRLGETYQEALDIKGNPSIDLDWYETKSKTTGETQRYTVAHWCTTEARFRNHLKKIKPEAAAKLIPLDNMLVRITQQDVVYRRYLDPGHRAFIPDFGVYHHLGGERQNRVPRPLAPVSHVLRGAAQGLAHVAIQGGHRQQGIRRPEGHSRRSRLWQDSVGRVPDPRPRNPQRAPNRQRAR